MVLILEEQPVIAQDTKSEYRAYGGTSALSGGVWASFAKFAQILKPWVEDEQIAVLTNDAKGLYKAFLAEGVKLKAVMFDSTLVAYLLNPEAKDLSVEALLSQYFDVTLPEAGEEHLFGLLKGIYVLSGQMLDRLVQEDLMNLYGKIELPLTELLAHMEHEGIRINTDYLIQLGEELTERIDTLTEKLYAAAGEAFNLNSSKQLGVILFEKLGLPVIKKTKTGYSTDAEVLDTLAEDYDFVKDILAYRQLTKLKSTYIEGILKLVDSDTNKVHTTFNQTITLQDG